MNHAHDNKHEQKTLNKLKIKTYLILTI